MGILDLFGSRESREQASLKKLAQKITQKWGPAENRQKAIEQLGENGTPAALKVLCLRFTVRAEVGISDDDEKEQARAILVAAGPKALEPVREFLDEQESGVAWGLRVLASLAPPAELLGTVHFLLQKLGREYTRDPEKKMVLLSWLRENPDMAGLTPVGGPSRDEAVIPLLEDFVDDVRIGAARALTVGTQSDAARDALIALLLRDRDNARVRGEVFRPWWTSGAGVEGAPERGRSAARRALVPRPRGALSAAEPREAHPEPHRSRLHHPRAPQPTKAEAPLRPGPRTPSTCRRGSRSRWRRWRNGAAWSSWPGPRGSSTISTSTGWCAASACRRSAWP